MGPGARNEGAEIQSGPVFIYILQQEIKKKKRERNDSTLETNRTLYINYTGIK